MKIKNLGKGSILIESKTGSILIQTEAADVSKVLEKRKPDIVVDPHADYTLSQGYLVAAPGEYEMSDIYVNAYVTQKGGSSPDILLIGTEEIPVGVMDSSASELSNDLLEDLGLVRVLILIANDKNSSIEKLVEQINKIDPFLVVIISVDDEEVSKLEKALGVGEFDKEKALTLKQSDFVDEDAPCEFVVLEKS